MRRPTITPLDALPNPAQGERVRIMRISGRRDPAKATPLSCLAAADYLEIAAKAILAKHLDPESADGDLTLALNLVARVEKALKACDVDWINRKDQRSPSGGQTDAPGEVTALAKTAGELGARAHEADKKCVSHEGDTEALSKEVTVLCEAETRTRQLAIMEPAACWGEIGIKLEQVLTNAGVLAHAIRPDDLADYKSVEHMLAEGIRQVLRDTARLDSAA